MHVGSTVNHIPYKRKSSKRAKMQLCSLRKSSSRPFFRLKNCSSFPALMSLHVSSYGIFSSSSTALIAVDRLGVAMNSFLVTAQIFL